VKKPRVCILRTAGTNCDMETAFAFSQAGAETEFVHINRFISREKRLDNYQILALPGGFTYGDDIAAGKVLANDLRFKLIDDIKSFIEAGKLIIGICNGFQILVKSGLLPGNGEFKQNTSLIINDCGKFQDTWVYLNSPQSKCVWTKDMPQVIYLPIAHGEGKFVAQDKGVLDTLKGNGQVVFRYCNEAGHFSGDSYNPNGSMDNIAGICDGTGRILGLMPHPERHIEPLQHPRWAGLKNRKEGDGLKIFKNGVEYALGNL